MKFHPGKIHHLLPVQSKSKDVKKRPTFIFWYDALQQDSIYIQFIKLSRTICHCDSDALLEMRLLCLFAQNCHKAVASHCHAYSRFGQAAPFFFNAFKLAFHKSNNRRTPSIVKIKVLLFSPIIKMILHYKVYLIFVCKIRGVCSTLRMYI